MPSLDSPLITLGALFLAGQDSRGRPFMGGESGKGYLAGGFAGASADWASDQVRSAAGVDQTQVSDELLQALIGAGVSRFGDPIPQNNAMARGILYNVSASAFGRAGLAAGDLVGDLTGGGTQGAPTQGTPTLSSVSQRAQRSKHRSDRTGNNDVVTY